MKKAPLGALSVRKNRFLKTNFPKCCAGILENRQVSCGFRLYLVKKFVLQKLLRTLKSDYFS
jgi:hypothetical protein